MTVDCCPSCGSPDRKERRHFDIYAPAPAAVCTAVWHLEDGTILPTKKSDLEKAKQDAHALVCASWPECVRQQVISQEHDYKHVIIQRLEAEAREQARRETWTQAIEAAHRAEGRAAVVSPSAVRMLRELIATYEEFERRAKEGNTPENNT